MILAERGGFEPPERNALNGFRDRPIQPLWHLSSGILIQGGARGQGLIWKNVPPLSSILDMAVSGNRAQLLSVSLVDARPRDPAVASEPPAPLRRREAPHVGRAAPPHDRPSPDTQEGPRPLRGPQPFSIIQRPSGAPVLSFSTYETGPGYFPLPNRFVPN